MIAALIRGSLFRQPEIRVSKSGKSFVKTTLRVRDGAATQWVNVIVFSESAQALLMRLGDGDAVAIQGSLKAEIYTGTGEPRVSLSLVADHVLALRQPAKKREPKAADPRAERPAGTWTPSRGDLNDSIPF